MPLLSFFASTLCPRKSICSRLRSRLHNNRGGQVIEVELVLKAPILPLKMASKLFLKPHIGSLYFLFNRLRGSDPDLTSSFIFSCHLTSKILDRNRRGQIAIFANIIEDYDLTLIISVFPATRCKK